VVSVVVEVVGAVGLGHPGVGGAGVARPCVWEARVDARIGDGARFGAVRVVTVDQGVTVVVVPVVAARLRALRRASRSNTGAHSCLTGASVAGVRVTV
jgi:hypothetical protein